jgi:hypothetical protein
MIRVLLSAPLCLHIRLSSRFTCWPEIWIVPAALFLLEDFVAVSQLIQLDIEALTDRTHPRISDKGHITLHPSCSIRFKTL